MSDIIVIEIVHNESGAVVVCDTLDHCLACDDGLKAEEAEIREALWRGEFYTFGGGAAEGFTIRPASTEAQALVIAGLGHA